jgi:hypothetical protein
MLWQIFSSFSRWKNRGSLIFYGKKVLTLQISPFSCYISFLGPKQPLLLEHCQPMLSFSRQIMRFLQELAFQGFKKPTFMFALCACLVRKSRFHEENIWQKSIKAINSEQNRTITAHRKKGDCNTNRSIIHPWHVIALRSCRREALIRISHTRDISWIQYRLSLRARSEGNEISPVTMLGYS